MTSPNGPNYTRRDVLKAAAAGAAVLSGGLGVAACGGGSSDSTSSATTAVVGSPKKGGILRVGVTGGGSGDNIDAGMFVTNTDGLRIYQLYNSLYEFDKNAQPVLSLAAEATPNAKVTKWTVRLKPDIEFHDGKPLTADDVIYTLKRIVNPKAPLLGATGYKTLDTNNIKKLDKLTVEIPFHQPFAAFPQVQATYFSFIVPVGYDPKHPIGTGPFKFKSFTPGQQSTFLRNDNYWEPSGGPYVDQVIISNYDDETSQINALNSGQLDLVDALSGASIPAIQGSGGKVFISNGELYGPFTMRTDVAPFNDVRVRQAMRLLVDRPQMLKLLFGDNGFVGNDLFCPFDKTYNHSIPQRTVDPDQAKSLLKQAGQEGMTATLVSSPVAAGSTRAAEVFAQQAKAAGVTINIKQVPVSEMYGPNYLKWTFAQDYWNYNPYVLNAQNATIPGGPFNECHVDYPPYTKLWEELSSTVDPAKQTELTHEMQQMEYDGHASGFVIPYFVPAIDGGTSKVNGITPSKTGNPLGGFDLRSVWLS
jgi:peptide/nickel transport system substrate-binding protein